MSQRTSSAEDESWKPSQTTAAHMKMRCDMIDLDRRKSSPRLWLIATRDARPAPLGIACRGGAGPAVDVVSEPGGQLIQLLTDGFVRLVELTELSLNSHKPTV